MKKRVSNHKYGIKDIDLKSYREIGMVDLFDDMIMGFEDSKAIEGVSNQHIQALLDKLVLTRNSYAHHAGIDLKPVKTFKRKIL